jgi:protein-L-isoaspartate(D-aspartate) O-methyltransferase
MSAAVDFERARFNMVEQQIRPWDVLDQSVLDLLYTVHREEFVPQNHRALALCDLEIPLGEEACERMWAPRVEARVLQELAVHKSEKVLEVGTGSGYLTALLARRGLHVTSVDINARLTEMGRNNLRQARIDNVTLETGDAARIWPGEYDVIVLTGSVHIDPEEYLARLKPAGRLFAIVGDEPVMRARLFTRDQAGACSKRDLFETSFPALKNAKQPERFRF